MKNNKLKTVKYNLFNLITITAGSMIGIGIFFKNAGVLAEAGSAWGAILAWLVGIAAVLTLAVSFFEIASSTEISKESGTIANWMSKFISPEAGKVTNIFWNYIWMPVITVTVGFFTVYFAQFAIGVDFNSHNLSHMIYIGGTALVLASLYFANAFSNRAGIIIQAITFIIKMIPLLLVAILGFINPSVVSADNSFAQEGTTSILAILLAVPGTLFALDTFLNGVALSKEEKNKGDAVKSTILSVLIVGAFYLLFSISVFIGTKDGDIFNLINNMAGSNSEVITKLVFGAIVVSAYGVLNGVTISGSRNIKYAHDNGFEFKKEFINKKTDSGAPTGAITYFFIITSAWFVVLFFSGFAMGPSLADDGSIIAQGYEVFIDQFSNVAVVGGFFIYSVIVFGALVNRKTNKVKVNKVKGFMPIAISALVINLTIVLIVFTQHLFSPDGIVKYFMVASIFIIAFINFANNNILSNEKQKKK